MKDIASIIVIKKPANQWTLTHQILDLSLIRATQLEAMSAQNSPAHPAPEVNFVKKPSKGADESSFVKDCRFCGQAHERERSKCPAFEKKLLCLSKRE